MVRNLADAAGRHPSDQRSTKTGTRNGKPTLTFTRDQDAITAAAQTDGVYALATSLPKKRPCPLITRRTGLAASEAVCRVSHRCYT